MRINFSNNNLSTWQKYHQQSVSDFKYYAQYLDTPRDMVSFQATAKIPSSAITYLNQRKKELGSVYDKFVYYNPLKLEGIQNGIEIFKGLSFSQVAYLIENFGGVIAQRGCKNQCIHCFPNARTPFYMKGNKLLDKIDFEDYKNLLDGFKELNERLDFNAFKDNKCTEHVLFIDADCSAIYLQDNSRKTYDYADLAKMLYDVTGKTVLFDTAGWNIIETDTQQRMEDLVKKIQTSGDKYKFLKFYISMNPFHLIYSNSVDLAKKGDMKNSERLREIYTDRMANVIFTFSPLIDEVRDCDLPMLDFIPRALKNETELQGYTEADLVHLMDEIKAKLKKMYSDDLMSEHPKLIHSEGQKEHYLNYVNEEFDHGWGDVTLVNSKLLKKLNGKYAAEHKLTDDMLYNSALQGVNFEEAIIDLNGKLYMTNAVETYPTDISLNYKNKRKQTAPIEPNLRDEVITKMLIENYYRNHSKRYR